MVNSLKNQNYSKDLKILGLEERLRTQMSYRFGSHSEKLFEQWLPLFDDLDDFPENELLTNEELEVLARKRYLSYAGEVPDKVETFKEIGDTVYIGFYWQGTSQSDSDFWLVDFYRVDRKTGVGFDSNDFKIDLTAYV